MPPRVPLRCEGKALTRLATTSRRACKQKALRSLEKVRRALKRLRRLTKRRAAPRDIVA